MRVVNNIVVCNGCGWVGNEEDLEKIFEVKGVGYTSGEINKLNLNVDDMCDGCPTCKSDDKLADRDFLFDLDLKALNYDEVGGDKDWDQYLHQNGWSSSLIATLKAKVDNRNYLIEILLKGEQRVFANFFGDELIPLDDSRGVNQRVSNSPNTLLEARELEGGSKKEYLYFGDNCWIEYDVKDIESGEVVNCYNFSNTVYGSISEVVKSLHTKHIESMFLAKLGGR